MRGLCIRVLGWGWGWGLKRNGARSLWCPPPSSCLQVVQREASAGDLRSLCEGVLLAGSSEATPFVQGLCAGFENIRHLELTPGNQVGVGVCIDGAVPSLTLHPLYLPSRKVALSRTHTKTVACSACDLGPKRAFRNT
jgi:hypothetical protein